MSWIPWRVAPLRIFGRWPSFEGWDQGNNPRQNFDYSLLAKRNFSHVLNLHLPQLGYRASSKEKHCPALCAQYVDLHPNLTQFASNFEP
jgi:hypothetical protein